MREYIVTMEVRKKVKADNLQAASQIAIDELQGADYKNVVSVEWDK